MQPFQIRVVEEHADLEKKIVALATFFSNPTFHKLPADEQERMYEQQRHMSAYADVLSRRIAAFDKAA